MQTWHCSLPTPDVYSNLSFQLGFFSLFTTFNSMSEHALTTSVFNHVGDWLAVASSHGQLVVWEWTSENYKLKQQAHFDRMNSVAYSPDGSLIATGGEDSKVC